MTLYVLLICFNASCGSHDWMPMPNPYTDLAFCEPDARIWAMGGFPARCERREGK